MLVRGGCDGGCVVRYNIVLCFGVGVGVYIHLYIYIGGRSGRGYMLIEVISTCLG